MTKEVNYEVLIEEKILFFVYFLKQDLHTTTNTKKKLVEIPTTEKNFKQDTAKSILATQSYATATPYNKKTKSNRNSKSSESPKTYLGKQQNGYKIGFYILATILLLAFITALCYKKFCDSSEFFCFLSSYFKSNN